MSILGSFKFSDISKRTEPPAMLMRRRMLAALDEQIQAATSEAAGQHFYRTVERTVKNIETGASERRTVERPVRKMWWRSNDTVMLEIRFSNRVMKVGNGNSIVVGSAANLIPILENLKLAVQNGELDEAMKATSDARKRGRKSGKPVGDAGLPVATVAKPATKAAK